jgi:hypothetical protein
MCPPKWTIRGTRIYSLGSPCYTLTLTKRYSSFDILRVGSISTEFKIDYDTQDAWFCQANHIFGSLGIQSSYENYGKTSILHHYMGDRDDR